MNRDAGYTLLEMVVVLAILGLATAMVAPATFRTIQSWRDADDPETVVVQGRDHLDALLAQGVQIRRIDRRDPQHHPQPDWRQGRRGLAHARPPPDTYFGLKRGSGA